MTVGIAIPGAELPVLRFLVSDAKFSQDLFDQIHTKLEGRMADSLRNNGQDIADLLTQNESSESYPILDGSSYSRFELKKYFHQKLLLRFL